MSSSIPLRFCALVTALAVIYSIFPARNPKVNINEIITENAAQTESEKAKAEWYLSQLLSQKSALVIGGTHGIGRHISLALAHYGADVSIVGPNYNDGQTIVKQMESVAKDNLERYPQKFDAFAYDLSTVGGCNNYTKLLQNNGLLFDILVLTMGERAENWMEQNSPEEMDKFVAEDLLSRFMILEGVKDLLTPGARIINVLGSVCAQTQAPSMSTIKKVISKSGDKSNFGPMDTMASICYSADSFVEQAALEYPSFKFISTHPGEEHTPSQVVSLLTSFPWNEKEIKTLTPYSSNRPSDIHQKKELGPYLWSTLEQMTNVKINM